jgi:hypothetical protein
MRSALQSCDKSPPAFHQNISDKPTKSQWRCTSDLNAPEIVGLVADHAVPSIHSTAMWVPRIRAEAPQIIAYRTKLHNTNQPQARNNQAGLPKPLNASAPQRHAAFSSRSLASHAVTPDCPNRADRGLGKSFVCQLSSLLALNAV